MLRDEGQSGDLARISLPFCYFLSTETLLPFPTTDVTFWDRQEGSSSSRLILNRYRKALTHAFASFTPLAWAAGKNHSTSLCLWYHDKL